MSIERIQHDELDYIVIFWRGYCEDNNSCCSAAACSAAVATELKPAAAEPNAAAVTTAAEVGLYTLNAVDL